MKFENIEQNTEKNNTQRIQTMISNLNIGNKNECLQLIMSLSPNNRLHYLNQFILAVKGSGEEAMISLKAA